MLGGGTTFGERLRRARLEAGLSQSDLELKSGIPKARLSRYENGHVLPSIGTLRKLAASLGVSEASLLGDQREIVEAFFHVLAARGVAIPSVEQARRLAEAVAELYEAFGLGASASGAEPVAVDMEPVASVSMGPRLAGPA